MKILPQLTTGHTKTRRDTKDTKKDLIVTGLEPA